LGRLAQRVEVNAGYQFGRLVEHQRSALDPTGEAAVQLLAWEVSDAEFRDPDNPGIPFDSPERRRMNELAGRLPPKQRPRGPGGYWYPSAAALLDDYRQGQSALEWNLGFDGPGLYREGADALRAAVDRLRVAGNFSLAVWALGLLGRLRLVLGELDRVAEIQTEGARLLERVEPGSNAASQFESFSMMRTHLVDVDYVKVVGSLERYSHHATRSDSRWGTASFRMWGASLRAAIGEHREALDELAANLGAVERGFIGAPNYPILVHSAAQILWWSRRTDSIDVLERNLHTKVLEPDFSYAEMDGRWTAALLCAVSGRYDEARQWFQQAYDRLTAQEAILLLPHVYCDEALMEVRAGPAGDRHHGLHRLDQTRRWIDHIGVPNLLPRVDDLSDQLVS
jgi:hypothetical protein